jgi:hypothetical protein
MAHLPLPLPVNTARFVPPLPEARTNVAIYKYQTNVD